MTTAAQLEANRRNALRSTGPRTEQGKRRSSMNAARHGFTGRLLVGLQHGPFADDPDELQEFIQSVLEELQPRSAQERAEALNIPWPVRAASPAGGAGGAGSAARHLHHSRRAFR